MNNDNIEFEHSSSEAPWKKMAPLFKQLWVLLSVILMAMFAGAHLGLVGCIVHGAVPAGDPVQITIRDSAWIATSPGISLMLFMPLASYTMDKFGRRASLAATTLPALVSSIVVSRAHSVTSIVIGRLILGISLEAMFLGAIITGEYSAPKYRGIFLNLKCAAMVLGSSITHFLNYYLDWRMLSLLTAPLVLVALAIMLTYPESPHWYVLKNRFEEAEESFFWLRGRSAASVEEFKSLVSAQKLRVNESNEINMKGNFATMCRALKKKDLLLPITAIFLSSVLLEAAGRHTFVTFAVKFIADIVGEKDKSTVYIAFIDLVTISSILLSCVLVRHIPRRVLMFSTGFSASFILILISLYLYFQSANMLPMVLKSVWIPISLLAMFFLLVNVGCIPICVSMFAELLPLAHKAFGLVIAGVSSKINIFVSLMLIPYLLSSIKVQGTFAVAALFMILALIGLYFTLPETKDKTLQEIEDAYMSRTNHNKVDGEELKEIISNGNNSSR